MIDGERISMIRKKWLEHGLINGTDVEFLLELVGLEIARLDDPTFLFRPIKDDLKLAILCGPLNQVEERLDQAIERSINRVKTYLGQVK